MLAAAKESNTSMTGTNNIALSNEREISSIPRYYMQDSEMPDSAHAPAESTEARVSHWVYHHHRSFTLLCAEKTTMSAQTIWM